MGTPVEDFDWLFEPALSGTEPVLASIFPLTLLVLSHGDKAGPAAAHTRPDPSCVCVGAHYRCFAGKLCRTYQRNTSQHDKNPSAQKFFRPRRNKEDRAHVENGGGISRLHNQFSKGSSHMSIRTRIALGISAVAISFSLAAAPAAFAQDKMGKDDAMKKDTMSKDSMKKDTMSKDGMKKSDAMSKDNMKKDDMKKN
jgi:pentapeptide MXKDX repeat protein